MPTSAPAAQTQMTRSALDRLDPWKDDGSIVLAVQGKYFRVHHSILSAHSEVFKDMFTCSHSNEAEKEFIEQCPVIHLHDAATDVQIVLKALYDRSYPSPQYEGILPISVVAAFLRLGEKYVIPVLVDEAKAKLYCSIEPTLIVASPPLGPFGLTKLPGISDLKQFPGIRDSDPHNFQIMNLLQEMDLKAPLPLAMYQCVITCPLTAIVDGYESNGSVYSLSPASIRSFIRMKDVIEKFRAQLAKQLSPSCTRADCRYYIHLLWREDITGVPPINSWKPEWNGLFCESCRRYMDGGRQRIMKKTWNQLPTVFGFGSWEEVRQRRDFST